jgi:hypothetical protein
MNYTFIAFVKIVSNICGSFISFAFLVLQQTSKNLHKHCSIFNTLHKIRIKNTQTFQQNSTNNLTIFHTCHFKTHLQNFTLWMIQMDNRNVQTQKTLNNLFKTLYKPLWIGKNKMYSFSRKCPQIFFLIVEHSWQNPLEIIIHHFDLENEVYLYGFSLCH